MFRFAFLFYHIFILFYLFYFFHFSLCKSLAEFTVFRFAFLFYHIFILFTLFYFFRNSFFISKMDFLLIFIYSKCCFLDDFNTIFCLSLRTFISEIIYYYYYYLSPSESSLYTISGIFCVSLRLFILLYFYYYYYYLSPSEIFLELRSRCALASLGLRPRLSCLLWFLGSHFVRRFFALRGSWNFCPFCFRIASNRSPFGRFLRSIRRLRSVVPSSATPTLNRLGSVGQP